MDFGEAKPLKPHNRRKLYNGKESKKYLEAAKKSILLKFTQLKKLIALAKRNRFHKFDASVEGIPF